MVTIDWCMKQRRGISKVQPNDNLCNEYMDTAEETLGILKEIEGKSKVWLATTKYYCEYFSIYALLMKLGIKSEIHDCTIALCKKLEELNVIPKGYHSHLKEDKDLRIDNQYYLKNRDVPFNYDEILKFVLKIKDINSKITVAQIQEIRGTIFAESV